MRQNEEGRKLIRTLTVFSPMMLFNMKKAINDDHSAHTCTIT